MQSSCNTGFNIHVKSLRLSLWCRHRRSWRQAPLQRQTVIFTVGLQNFVSQLTPPKEPQNHTCQNQGGTMAWTQPPPQRRCLFLAKLPTTFGAAFQRPKCPEILPEYPKRSSRQSASPPVGSHSKCSRGDGFTRDITPMKIAFKAMCSCKLLVGIWSTCSYTCLRMTWLWHASPCQLVHLSGYMASRGPSPLENVRSCPPKGRCRLSRRPFRIFWQNILWIFWQNVFLGFEHAVALTFWLRNSLGATAGCTFWTFIPPDGSAPATLASNTLEKHGFSTFSCTWIFFLLSLYIGFSDSSQECGCICPKSEVWLLNFLHFPSKSFE